MGDDFAYYFAEETYQFIDRFAELMKEHSQGRFEFVYSSPEQYI